MDHDQWVWGIFLLLGMATILPRSSFILLQDRIHLPEWVRRALRYAPAAALAAVIAPDVFMVQGNFTLWNAKPIATLVVVGVVYRWRNPWLPFLLGMGVLLFFRRYLGWQ